MSLGYTITGATATDIIIAKLQSDYLIRQSSIGLFPKWHDMIALRTVEMAEIQRQLEELDGYVGIGYTGTTILPDGQISFGTGDAYTSTENFTYDLCNGHFFVGDPYGNPSLITSPHCHTYSFGDVYGAHDGTNISIHDWCGGNMRSYTRGFSIDNGDDPYFELGELNDSNNAYIDAEYFSDIYLATNTTSFELSDNFKTNNGYFNIENNEGWVSSSDWSETTEIGYNEAYTTYDGNCNSINMTASSLMFGDGWGGLYLGAFPEMGLYFLGDVFDNFDGTFISIGNGLITLSNVPSYNNDDDARDDGLETGQIYKHTQVNVTSLCIIP